MITRRIDENGRICLPCELVQKYDCGLVCFCYSPRTGNVGLLTLRQYKDIADSIIKKEGAPFMQTRSREIISALNRFCSLSPIQDSSRVVIPEYTRTMAGIDLKSELGLDFFGDIFRILSPRLQPKSFQELFLVK